MIAGGLFSINAQRFIDTGKYDAEMDIWGGENFGKSLATHSLYLWPEQNKDDTVSRQASWKFLSTGHYLCYCCYHCCFCVI